MVHAARSYKAPAARAASPAAGTLAREIFARLGRPGQHAIYGLANLVRRYAREDIEAACTTVLTFPTPSNQALKRILERRLAAAVASSAAESPRLVQSGEIIRAMDDYHAFFEQHAHSAGLNGGLVT